MKDFRQLQVWQRAHKLVLRIYGITREFPSDEKYGLTSQIRRAAASIPTNIAEGCGRSGDAELARFCQIAMGSASEVEYQLMLGKDLGYIPPEDYEELNGELTTIKRMLNAFIQKLK